MVLSKVLEVTLTFWIIKIAATTLGETGGDSVTMTLNWGYLAGSALFRTLRSPRTGRFDPKRPFGRCRYGKWCACACPEYGVG